MHGMNRFVMLGFAVAFLVVLSACSSPAPEVTETGDGFKQVEAVGMTLRWRVVDDMAEFIVTSPEQGWVGVGFDAETVMRGADIIIGYVEPDGTVVIEDHYGDGLTSHRRDTELGGSDDVEIIGGEVTSDGTMLHFRRPLDSGDQYDKPLVPGQTHKFMLAYGMARDLRSDHGPNARASFSLEF